MNRLLAMSSSSDDITTKPFKAFTRSLRLCEITPNNLLYLIKTKRKRAIMAKNLGDHCKEKKGIKKKMEKDNKLNVNLQISLICSDVCII